jgi:hypothetical protein
MLLQHSWAGGPRPSIRGSPSGRAHDSDNDAGFSVGAILRKPIRGFFILVREQKPAQFALRGFCFATVLADRSDCHQLSA